MVRIERPHYPADHQRTERARRHAVLTRFRVTSLAAQLRDGTIWQDGKRAGPRPH
jgi:hypothetical protein